MLSLQPVSRSLCGNFQAIAGGDGTFSKPQLPSDPCPLLPAARPARGGSFHKWFLCKRLQRNSLTDYFPLFPAAFRAVQKAFLPKSLFVQKAFHLYLTLRQTRPCPVPRVRVPGDTRPSALRQRGFGTSCGGNLPCSPRYHSSSDRRPFPNLTEIQGPTCALIPKPQDRFPREREGVNEGTILLRPMAAGGPRAELSKASPAAAASPR